MLKELLISEVRVNLLKFLVKNFENEFHVRALVRELGVEINAVRRELEKLTNLNILTKNPWGNKIFYKINSSNPYFYDLVNFVHREDGIANKILKNFSSLGEIKYIALAKEFCMGRKSSGIDLDLSRCLFVFSYNDESLINPILRDRLVKIHLKMLYLQEQWPEMTEEK
mgnify:CR=1 FL=1